MTKGIRSKQQIFIYNKASSLIKDATRRDTAAPSFLSPAIGDLFQQAALAGLCLPLLWLILFGIVRSSQILSDFTFR